MFTHRTSSVYAAEGKIHCPRIRSLVSCPQNCRRMHHREVSSRQLRSGTQQWRREEAQVGQSRTRGVVCQAGSEPDWSADRETWTPEEKARYAFMIQRFSMADANGDGVIDRSELRSLLESAGGGTQYTMQHWLTEKDLDDVMARYDADGNGTISFDEFVVLARDGILLEGKLEEYEAAFKSLDTNGNGTIGASELAVLFQNIGQPLSYEKLVQIMSDYDVDQSGQIEFGEFLRMFQGNLLDLKAILSYMKLREVAASPSADAIEAEKSLDEDRDPLVLFSGAELDEVLKASGDQLVCLMATLTWCRPCKGMQRPYQKLADHYSNVVFLKLFGNSNDNCKDVFKNRLKCRVTPTFFFFRNGEIIHQHTGANKVRLESFLQQFLQDGEKPPSVLYPFGSAVKEEEPAPVAASA